MRICPSTHRVRRTTWNKSSSSTSFAASIFASCRALHAKCMPYLIPTPTHTHTTNSQLATEDEKERKEEKEIYIPVSIHKLMSRNKKGRSTIFSQETKALAKDLLRYVDIDIDHAINPFQLIIARVTCNWSEQNYGLIRPVLSSSFHCKNWQPHKIMLGSGFSWRRFPASQSTELLWANQDKNVLPCSGHHHHSTPPIENPKQT